MKRHLIKKKKSVQQPEEKKNFKAYREEFNGIVRDIRKLTFDSLGKFEKKKIEAANIEATGRKAEKMRRMPMPELRLRKCAAERAIAKQCQQEEELGVKLYHGNKTLHQAQKEKRLQIKNKTRRKEKSSADGISAIGYEKNGHLIVSSKFLKKYT